MASKKLNPSIFGEKLYNKFPALYRRSDEDVDYALKRFILALNDGGFSYVIQELNGILELCDPEKTPKDVLSIMFSQYGLNITHDFPEVFMRKLLPLVGDLYKRKGSIPAIEYIAACISNAKTNITVEDYGLENPELTLRLEIDSARDSEAPSVDQLRNVVKEFIPFFCTLIVVYVYFYLETAELSTTERWSDNLSVSHSSQGNLYPVEQFSDEISYGYSESINLPEEELADETGIILNVPELHLNEKRLNTSPRYVKITQAGEVRYVLLTPYGVFE